MGVCRMMIWFNPLTCLFSKINFIVYYSTLSISRKRMVLLGVLVKLINVSYDFVKIAFHVLRMYKARFQNQLILYKLSSNFHTTHRFILKNSSTPQPLGNSVSNTRLSFEEY